MSAPKAKPDWLEPGGPGDEVSERGIQGTFNGPNEGAGGLGGWIDFGAGEDDIGLDGRFSAAMLRDLAAMLEANAHA